MEPESSKSSEADSETNSEVPALEVNIPTNTAILEASDSMVACSSLTYNTAMNVAGHMAGEGTATTQSALLDTSSGLLEADLSLLGVSSKSQADIEQTVFQLIQKKEQEKRIAQLKKSVTGQLLKLRNGQKQLVVCESSLAQLYAGSESTSSRRKISSLLNDQEKLTSDLAALKEDCRSLLGELERLNYDFSGTDPGFRQAIGGFWPNERAAGKSAAVDLTANDETEETEQEKSVRLGELTAFGNSLTTVSEQSSSAQLQSYLRQQQVPDLNSGDKDNDGKRKRKEENNEEPSGSSKRQKVKAVEKRKSKKKKEVLRADSDEDAWHTDDSDWEGTDDEEDEARALLKRRQTHFDDGDKDSYLARMAEWRATSQEGHTFY